MQHAPEASPNRCQGNDRAGQCRVYAMRDSDGNFVSKFCARHGGHNGLTAAKKQAKYAMNLGKWQDRVGELAGSSSIKSLRQEIGVMRMMLESRLSRVKTEVDLEQAIGPIGEMILKIEKLVVSCQKIEEKMGATLDKSAVLSIATQILEVISTVLDSSGLTPGQAEEILAGISEGVAQVMTTDSE